MKVKSLLIIICALACFQVQAARGTSTNKKGINGIWQSEGYGYVMVVKNNKAQIIYDVTDIHALKVPYGSHFVNHELELWIRNDGKLIADRPQKLSYYVFERIEELPEKCKNWKDYRTEDAQQNFEVFWQTMKEHYAFFDRRGVDWDQVKADYASQISKETSKEELFKIFTEISMKFCDAHIAFDADDWWMHPNFKDKYLLDKEAKVDQAIYESKDWTAGLVGNKWEELGYDEIFPVIKGHLDANASYGAVPDFNRTGNGKILYGKMSDNTAYVCFLEQGGFYHQEGPEAKETEFSAFQKCLDTLVAYFVGTDKLVVDLRFNTGGEDTYGIWFAERFAEQRTLAFTKKAIDGQGYTEEIKAWLHPTGKKKFDAKEIKVLTSRNSISAAETFVLALRPLDNVEIIGDATCGSLSDMLDKQLPNGWSFSLSNEVYTSHDGIVFEGKGAFGTGIAPDRQIEFEINDFLVDGRDPILEAALEE